MSTIVETAVKAGSFRTLVKAIQAAGLAETLSGQGPFTVFAPTDEAFAKIPKETLQDLLKPENKTKLQAILTYHVVPGKLTTRDVAKRASLKTAQGESLPVEAENGVKVGGATVTLSDLMADNGVIHVIDAVVMPTR